jgi:hypothetical protein
MNSCVNGNLVAVRKPLGEGSESKSGKEGRNCGVVVVEEVMMKEKRRIKQVLLMTYQILLLMRF